MAWLHAFWRCCVRGLRVKLLARRDVILVNMCIRHLTRLLFRARREGLCLHVEELVVGVHANLLVIPRHLNSSSRMFGLAASWSVCGVSEQAEHSYVSSVNSSTILELCEYA
jgi:hypothetical protein